MRTKVICISLTLLYLSNCSGVRTIPATMDPTPEKSEPTSGINVQAMEGAKEEIYRAVASQHCREEIVYVKPQIQLHQLFGHDIERAHQELERMTPQTWDNFQNANRPEQALITFSDFPINCSYEFASSTSEGCYDGQSVCIAPYGFSQIGFDPAQTQALIYMYKDCSECGGWGKLFLLESV